MTSGLGVVPFVGAGLSIPWGFPSWQSFLIEASPGASVEQRVRSHLDSQRYEEAASEIQAALGPGAFDALMELKFGERAIRRPRPTLTIRMLTRVAAGPVLTTNFDRVLETVFREEGRPFHLVLWGGQSGRRRTGGR